MSKTVHIQSAAEFESLLKSSKTVVVDFYADWCGPCKTIAPIYEQLSAKHSRPSLVTFAKVNTDQQQQIAQKYGITAMPTFLLFSSARKISTVQGANAKALAELASKASALADEAGGAAGAASSSTPAAGGASGTPWLGASVPRGYADVTDQIDVRGAEVLNADSAVGNGVRTLFDGSRPAALSRREKAKGKGKASGGQQAAPGSGAGAGAKDWLESDTDEQLMLFMPFQATLKVHSLQLTSLPPTSDDDDNNERPMRPAQIQLYTNHPHTLGFEEADATPPVQTLSLTSKDWDPATGTATLDLRFVKFQNVASLVLFVVSGDGSGGGERTRLDRVRVLGESGVKRDMGRLEKVGDDE